jgi:hypothetical protein
MNAPVVRVSLSATGLVAALSLLVACSGGVTPTVTPTSSALPTAGSTAQPTSGPTAEPTATPVPTPEPTPTPLPPSPTPEVGQIDHPTGATDVVLRLESGGGMVPFGFFATQAPAFTLYGDNTVIFRPSTDPAGTGFPPFVRAVMNAAQVDALLRFALTQGHLAGARESYSAGGIADAPTTYFTINAAGIKKLVSVYGLGIATDQMGADAADFLAFGQLGAVLGDFEKEVRKGQVVSADIYVPRQYRAVLIDSQGMEGAVAWPWTDLTPADFATDPDNSSTHLAAISADQAGHIATMPSGGLPGIAVLSPDGTKQFTLSLRPLLPGDNLQPASLPSIGY